MKIKEESTKEKFERIWKGLDYHMDELARFFLENEKDPFLETEYGKEMEEYSKKMSGAYLMGKITAARKNVSDFITKMMCVDDDEEPKEIEKPKEGEKTFSMEDMLNSVFKMNNDKKEDAEP